MVLSLWMQGAVVLAFGCCAWMSSRHGYKQGYTRGILGTLGKLYEDQVITFDHDGTPKPVIKKLRKAK